MSIQIGQTVRVKANQQDDDTGVSIAGWSGRVIASHPEAGTLEVEWDSRTLAQLPDIYIRNSLDGGYDYFRYFIEREQVEATQACDSVAQVKAIQEALEAHYHEYELSGQRPEPFSSAGWEPAAPEDAKAAAAAEQELLGVLKTIQGSGSFSACGVRSFTHPGLHVEGVGEIGLPLTDGQARDIIRQARQAPFGKGGQTFTDITVRNSWEIDAGRLSFQNKEWDRALEEILASVKQGLGIENRMVNASLYKLLLYEEGGFFLPHQDSEKEEGMFATLVVGLPATHTGGELLIRFDGREEKVEFAPAASNYKIPFAAFYSDCEHEIQPLRSGYRLCLVYNLLQSSGARRIGGPQFGPQVEQMTRLLRSLEAAMEWRPRAVLLDHQYTPANFSRDYLKLHDRPQAEALMAAAEKGGYFANLGLVTLYRMGEWEDGYDYYYSRRRNRYYDYDEEEVSGEETMGEVYEEYTTVEIWEKDTLPGLGALNIREGDILSDFTMGEGDPIEKEAEGYTGNAGMTLQYWYHYGAVILWPKQQHAALIHSLDVPHKLEWLTYYLQHWEDAELHPQERTRQLLGDLEDQLAGWEGERSRSADFSAVATAFTQLADEQLLRQQGAAILPVVFDEITVEAWLSLLQHVDLDAFHPIFQKATRTGDILHIDHLLNILKAAEDTGSRPLSSFALHHLRRLPDHLSQAQLYKLKEPSFRYFDKSRSSRLETTTAIIENVLSLSVHTEDDPDWIEATLEALTCALPRKYVNQGLAPVLVSRKYQDRKLAKALNRICIQQLKARTEIKPSPPADWAREVPKATRYKKEWDVLTPFLLSPTKQVFDYQANQSHRTDMERAIKSAKADLKMTTIKKGRPYTLRLTKTQATYERKLRKWEEDMVLLKQLKETAS